MAPHFENPVSVISAETIFACPEYEIVIFRLPKGSVIPLHDHPLMFVFGKILFGKLKIIAFDWTDEKDQLGQPDKANLSATSFPGR